MAGCVQPLASPLRRRTEFRFARGAVLWGIVGAMLALPDAALAADGTAAERRSTGCPIDEDELVATGATIRNIKIENLDIFDTDDPEEDKALFRLMNRLHTRTKASVVRKELLFKPGQAYDRQALDETERILRRRSYLYDAEIDVIACEDNTVDIRVRTQDVWTLQPSIYLSRSGGETRSGFDIQEENLLGRGGSLRFARRNDEERTSTALGFTHNNLDGGFLSISTAIEENSDGYVYAFGLERPFYALDTRRAAGGTARNERREDQVYALGDEIGKFQQDLEQLDLYYGWSDGLQDGWTRRWLAGFVFDDRAFQNVNDSIDPALVPEDRRLIYPYIGYELIENRYRRAANLDQIYRTEDVLVGAQLSLRLGALAPGLGADRSGFVFSGRAGRGLGDPNRVFWELTTHASGRLESGELRNAIIGGGVRWYLRQSERRLLFATVFGDISEELDLDNPLEIGGDIGLRGYPLRYQRGDSRAQFTLEQRYFTDYYLWRLLRVGGAVFFDAGRVWGENPYGGENLGLLTDVGFGLRLSSTRSSLGRMIHLDLAFPLDGDSSIDKVQFLITGQRGF